MKNEAEAFKRYRQAAVSNDVFSAMLAKEALDRISEDSR